MIDLLLTRKPLLFVELTPLTPLTLASDSDDSQNQSNLSTAMVKQILLQKMGPYRIQDDLDIQWETHNGQNCQHVSSGSIISTSNPQLMRRQTDQVLVPVVYFPSEDPTQLDGIPCSLLGYCQGPSMQSPQQDHNAKVVFTEATLLRILPTLGAYTVTLKEGAVLSNAQLDELPIVAKKQQQPWLDLMTGESPEPTLHYKQLFVNYNSDAIDELRRRLSLLLNRSISIGTTADAFLWNNTIKIRSQALQQHLINTPTVITTEEHTNTYDDTSDAALLVHSPHHGAGKTLLVKALAQELGAVVHVIHGGAGILLAKYGIHADAALESTLHSIVMSAAVRRYPICIILDSLDAMLPMKSATRGDSALPILTAMASYLKSLTLSIQNKGQFPFPTKNPLYNLGGSHGACLPVHIGIVGVVTCQDSAQQIHTFSPLVGGRYRLPELSAVTRLVAFQHAFDNEGLVLSKSARSRLPVFAASHISIRGAAFGLIAKHLRRIVTTREKGSNVQAKDLSLALECYMGCSTDSEIMFMADKPEESSEANMDLFSSVGGNREAKYALEEALALDPLKRNLLRRFGLLPPAGVLLFGPPGTGKTLLAKAVAKMLRSKNDDSIGGVFISLQASDIVQAEVGTSEKMLVAAFETARKNAPSVIFIDEFQAIFTERSGSGSGKLASTLLQCLDDINRWAAVDDEVENIESQVNFASNRVVVLGATNTPWMIDKAFLRAGRFDRTVHVGLPSQQDRVDILQVHVAKMSLQIVDDNRDQTITSLCSEMSAKTQGFSGADLAALCRAAAVRCLRDSKNDADGNKVTISHFLDAVTHDVMPCSNASLVDQLLNWRP